MNKSEFKKIPLGAIAYIVHYRAVLFKALAFPVIATIALDVVSVLFPFSGPIALLSLATIPLSVLIAVITHRVVLLGSDSITQQGWPPWTKRETAFFGYSVALLLFVSVPEFLLLIGVIPILGMLLLYLIGVWLLARLSLVLPGTAIDKPMTFTQSWEITKPFGWQMLYVVILYPLILGIPMLILQFLPFAWLLSSIYTMFVTVVTITALSLAYKFIAEQSDELISFE